MAYSKEQRNEYTNAWRSKRKLDALNKLGNKCTVCNSTDDLQFDHIDPKTKEYTIAAIWTASKAIFEAELAKCQLLCRQHHNEKTSIDVMAKHGSFARYQRHGCRCDQCREFYNKYQREWKQKRRVSGRADECA